MSRVTRDIVGPTGWVFSDAWQKLDDHGKAYRDSFDRRLPPSLFVSDRDRLRASQPMPLAERCIEDWSKSNQGADKRGPDNQGADKRGPDKTERA